MLNKGAMTTDKHHQQGWRPSKAGQANGLAGNHIGEAKVWGSGAQG
jgi:hypothetical protein